MIEQNGAGAAPAGVAPSALSILRELAWLRSGSNSQTLAPSPTISWANGFS